MGNTLGTSTPEAVHERLSETELEDLWALFEALSRESVDGVSKPAYEAAFSRSKLRAMRVHRDVFVKHVLPDHPTVSNRLFDTFVCVNPRDPVHLAAWNNVSSNTASTMSSINSAHSNSQLGSTTTTSGSGDESGDGRVVRLPTLGDTVDDVGLDWAHFAVGMVLVTRAPWKDKLHFLFQLFDLTASGRLTRPELQAMLSSSLFAGNRLNRSLKSGESVLARSSTNSTSAAASARSPDQRRKESSRVYLRALWSYEGRREDELSFEKGDVIKLVQKYDNNWWLGNFRGQNGYVPANYVEEASPDLATSKIVQFGRTIKPITVLARYLTEDAFAVSGGGRFMTEKQFRKWATSSYQIHLLISQLQQLDLTPPRMAVTSPHNFRRGKGYSERGGLDLTSVPTELRELLLGAGYEQEDLDDKETADMVVRIVADKMDHIQQRSYASTSGSYNSHDGSGSVTASRPLLIRPTGPPPPVPTTPAPEWSLQDQDSLGSRQPSASKAPLSTASETGPSSAASSTDVESIVPEYEAPSPPKQLDDAMHFVLDGPPPAPAIPPLMQSAETVTGQEPRLGLLESIRHGMQLKHVSSPAGDLEAAGGSCSGAAHPTAAGEEAPAPAGFFSEIEDFQHHGMRHVSSEAFHENNEIDGSSEVSSSAGDAARAGGLLGEIANFRKHGTMRHVDLEALQVDQLSQKKKEGLMGILNDALESRRRFVQEQAEQSYDSDLFPEYDSDEW